MTMLAARDPAERVELLIKLTERLTALLNRETELFEARAPHMAQDFQPEKAELATLYRRETARIARDPSLVGPAPAPRRAALAAVTRVFHEALAANQRAGEALRIISEGIVRAVAEEVARLRGAAPVYGAPGQALAASAGASASAITLDRTV